MAPSLKQFSCVLFVFIFASLCVEARQSMFFSGVMVSNSIKMGSSPLLETPTGAPAPAPVSGGDDDFPPLPFESGIGFVPAPAPAPAFFETDNPYGLYAAGGDEENEINPNVEFSSSNERTEIPNDHEFSNERLTEFNTKEPFNNNNNNNDNNFYNSNYNNNGYSNNYYSNNNNNGYSSSNFYSNGYTNGFNGNGYESSERQGMSDTRFLENGKYSYDSSNENYNYQNENETKKGSNSNGGYYGERSRYEFGSMEEYERQQGYP